MCWHMLVKPNVRLLWIILGVFGSCETEEREFCRTSSKAGTLQHTVLAFPFWHLGEVAHADARFELYRGDLGARLGLAHAVALTLFLSIATHF